MFPFWAFYCLTYFIRLSLIYCLSGDVMSLAITESSLLLTIIHSFPRPSHHYTRYFHQKLSFIFCSKRPGRNPMQQRREEEGIWILPRSDPALPLSASPAHGHRFDSFHAALRYRKMAASFLSFFFFQGRFQYDVSILSLPLFLSLSLSFFLSFFLSFDPWIIPKSITGSMLMEYPTLPLIGRGEMRQEMLK